MASENPYTPPASDIQEVVQAPAIEAPQEILSKIKGAWVAALVSASLTLVLILIAISGTRIYSFDAWALIDVFLILGLAFGIYRKNRACAVVMLVYFVFSKIVLLIEGAPAASLPMAFIFLYFYWQGVVGTFRYHALLKQSSPLA
jgi:serine/threonine-protein kinase